MSLFLLLYFCGAIFRTVLSGLNQWKYVIQGACLCARASGPPPLRAAVFRETAAAVGFFCSVLYSLRSLHFHQPFTVFWKGTGPLGFYVFSIKHLAEMEGGGC